MRLLFSDVLNAPESDATGGGNESSEDSFEFLNTEDDAQEEEILDIKGTKKVDSKESSEGEGSEEDEGEGEEREEEDDELKEIEDELKGPSDEDLELTTPVRRKEILAKYPQLFKDFPYLEKAYYRDQQFTEVFPTVQDARVAIDKSKALDNVERQIMNGDLTGVLHAAKQESQEAFFKVADNYLPALRQVDQQAYYHVLGNVIKDTIITMVKEGRNLGEQGAPLTAAANVLNQFVFGSQNFVPPKNLSRDTPPEEQNREREYQQQERTRVMNQFETVKDELQTKADNALKATISHNIDPKGTMTDYVKGHATREALDTLSDLMSKDTRFRGLLDRLWEKAFEKKFDKESTDRIKSAYLSKAKTLLPSVVKKARNDALRGMGRRVGSEEQKATDKKGPITPGRSTTQSTSGKYKKSSDIPRNVSTLDVLMGD